VRRLKGLCAQAKSNAENCAKLKDHVLRLVDLLDDTLSNLPPGSPSSSRLEEVGAQFHAALNDAIALVEECGVDPSAKWSKIFAKGERRKDRLRHMWLPVAPRP